MARRTRGGGTGSRAAARKPKLLLHEKVVLPDDFTMEIVLWQLPAPQTASPGPWQGVPALAPPAQRKGAAG